MYPLASYDRAIEFLDVLRPTDSPFGYFRRHPDGRDDRAAADLFDSFSRLLATLILGKVQSKRPSKRLPLAQRALSKKEQDLLASLDRLVQVAMPLRRGSRPAKVVFSPEHEVKTRPSKSEPDTQLPRPTSTAIDILELIEKQVSVLKATLLSQDSEQ